MAATLMQPPVHRHSMDHTPSFDHARSSPSAPFATSSFERGPSPSTSTSTSNIQAPRSRTGSSNLASPSPSSSAPSPSAPSPVPPGAAYPQHYQHFPPPPHHFPQHWPQGAAHPGAGFYAPPYGAFPGATGYQQQAPSDFAAWAHVYQRMVASGHMPGPGVMPTHYSQDVDDYGPPMADPPRRRTASGPNTSVNATVIPGKGAVFQPQPFHPYKRGPIPNRGHRNDGAPGASMNSTTSGGSGIRMTSNPVPGQARGTPPPSDEHRRNLSSDSAQLRSGGLSAVGADVDFAPPKLRTDDRRNSSSSHGSGRSGSASPTTHSQHNPSGTSSPTTHARSRSTSGSSSPLTTGTIATNATNAARPSPLSQAQQLPAGAAPLDQKKSGAKGRFKPSLASNPAKDKSAPPSQVQPTPSRAEQSNTSRLPRANGSVPLAPPSAPFANAQAMGSDVSLAETQRTAQTIASVATGATGKSRRGLFRMRNKSSDNISLSSTVSSASMMIRKMGSLGKLARRNSLMGISKIFKDKPKDEDAALPEKQGILGFKKKSGKKSEASPAAVSHAYAELDRDLDRLSEEHDRILSGLSPAAALARQHTVKSRAEQAKKTAEKKATLEGEAALQKELEAAEMGRTTGVSTWDSNTTTRANQPTYAAAAADAASVPMGPTNVLKVMPRQPHVVHHAFAVNQPDYDSDDSSEGDTIENVASDLRLASISDPADRDFEALWGKASIDPNARPKKGILKICVSNEDLEKLASQHQQQQQQKAQSAPTTPPMQPEAHPGRTLDLASPNPERIDGNAHAPHAEDPKFDIDFSSFDTSPDLDLKPPVIYKNPIHNSSVPGISRSDGIDPHARAMSAPSRRRLIWAPECAVYSTYDALTYDRRSEPATCNRLTPELAMAIKQELNAFKLEMPVHPSSRIYTHYFA
ncbi:uncharacterized protein CcaverHIS019_0104340 [Cutaneotrichosporon cavernicola]|uniref:Uncharacterized protein n=1 Tax=Cutaneotrichosporon cavernicola TaxID=279322 RepID=A0AA48HYA2_9TREE|nr:uncharacterized protein CcaverHIS019_0104340 [Cutaneotrichosporon cavernicola]BEI87716.1 hypothetical protein CcaverHIS019_0104340 [Cutaneotrichosporon cavernicola]BEI95487.1 hypothetical protein CcaverHIS631_0104360 [Cutaneotrichosporon cavernicola]BEJ03261.1 hypothetical protein CcaverHIS641_0104360 [Cutaneotrichosporon cavernicola]